jgi:sugar lactone lactonase YvrE
VAAGGSIGKNEKAGTIYKFTPTGVRTTFASGLNSPFALAFDSQGNLFVADHGYGYDFSLDAAVYKFAPSGLRSTVVSVNDQVPVVSNGLAIDTADNLFVSDGVSRSILKFTPRGVRTTFAARFVTAVAFQRNLAPNPAPIATVIDFNGDGHPDFVVRNPATRQTAIWHLNNNVLISGVFGPTLPAGWG